MYCEIRKSCSLRNVAYEIGRLAAPVGVVLVDTSGLLSTELFKSPRDKFWEELITVFRDVKQAYEYTLEEDIHLHMSDATITGPIILEIDQARAVTRNRIRDLAKRLRDLGVKRVVMVCITGGIGGADYAERLASTLELTNENSRKPHGIDLMVILDDNAGEGDF